MGMEPGFSRVEWVQDDRGGHSAADRFLDGVAARGDAARSLRQASERSWSAAPSVRVAEAARRRDTGLARRRRLLPWKPASGDLPRAASRARRPLSRADPGPR